MGRALAQHELLGRKYNPFKWHTPVVTKCNILAFGVFCGGFCGFFFPLLLFGFGVFFLVVWFLFLFFSYCSWLVNRGNVPKKTGPCRER